MPPISSDAFVQSYRPLDTIAAAMHRVTPSGFPVGPDQELGRVGARERADEHAAIIRQPMTEGKARPCA